MECAHAYKITGSRYIYCDFEGTPHGKSLDEITPYLCFYQPFPPPFQFPVKTLLPSWIGCVKLKEEQDKRKYVRVSDWFSDGTYSDYPYRAIIPTDGATVEMFPYVEFEQPEMESGNYADVSATYDGGVYIYCKEIPDHDFYVTVNLYTEMQG